MVAVCVASAAQRWRERARARGHRFGWPRRQAGREAPGCSAVVAAGRRPAGLERAADHGADATLRLDEHDDLVAAFRNAFGGDGPTYVFGAVWGEPGAAAVFAAAPNATIVNLGQSAGATAALSSEAVRFKSLAILGFSVYAVPFDVLAEHYRRLVDHAVAGDIRLDV